MIARVSSLQIHAPWATTRSASRAAPATHATGTPRLRVTPAAAARAHGFIVKSVNNVNSRCTSYSAGHLEGEECATAACKVELPAHAQHVQHVTRGALGCRCKHRVHGLCRQRRYWQSLLALRATEKTSSAQPPAAQHGRGPPHAWRPRLDHACPPAAAALQQFWPNMKIFQLTETENQRANSAAKTTHPLG